MPDDLDSKFELLRAYKLLDVASSATDDEVRQAYHDWVKMYHPDRFQNDAGARAKAEEKLKAVNAAYESVMAGRAASRANSQQAAAPKTAAAPPPPVAPPTARPNPTVSTAPSQTASGGGLVFGLVIGALVLLILLGAAVSGTGGGTSTSQSSTADAPVATAVPPPPPPTAQQLAAQKKAAAAAKTKAAHAAAAEKKRAAAAKAAAVARAAAARKAAAAASKYIHLGSTQADVRRIQGTPTEVSGDTWSYNYSTVTFTDGVVSGWFTNGTRLKVGFATKQRPGATFTVGSTPEQVLSAQGTPTEVSGDTWGYDYSTVTFTNGVVSGWFTNGTRLRTR